MFKFMFKFKPQDLSNHFRHQENVFQNAREFGAPFAAEPRFDFDQAKFDGHGNGVFPVSFATKEGEGFPGLRAFVTFAFNDEGTEVAEAEFINPNRFSSLGVLDFVFPQRSLHNHARVSA
jgi:hypothetical protein